MDKKFIENSFLFGGNTLFIEELYDKYTSDQNSVDKEWQDYFKNLQELAGSASPSWVSKKKSLIGVVDKEESAKKIPDQKNQIPQKAGITEFSSQLLLDKFRSLGHLLATLDPLGLEPRNSAENLRLDNKSLGLSDEDLGKKISISTKAINAKESTIQELINVLRRVYCGTIGFEIDHISSSEQKEWLYNKAENLILEDITSQRKKEILRDLVEVEGFEQFIHSRFPGAKRFSVEGGDSTIIAVDQVIKTASQAGEVEYIIIGMAHRGRLNMLTKIIKKSYVAMLSEFQGNLAHLEDLNFSGDVKYHLGKSSEIILENGKKIYLSLTSNPSHLEAVNPIVLGKVRAKQDIIGDNNRTKVMGITLHGDAAFAGQGVVAESLSLGDLDAYNTGGTMHIVTNNQVGFTTSPKNARTSRYPTEFGKIIQAPIIHVNADDPEAVVKVAKIAEEFRQKFKKDVIIDICCYRRYGHNESDEPMFTQPIMYKKIKEHKTVAKIYGKKLINSAIVSENEFNLYESEFLGKLDGYYNESKTYKPSKSDWLEGLWSGMAKYDAKTHHIEKTGIELAKLKEIGKSLASYPDSFHLNSKLQRLLEVKKQMFETGENIDWATGEALALGSLLIENLRVRMSGQDCRRGTFSNRHAVLIDQENESTYTPLNNISKLQKQIEIYDSNLSEFAVLGFEYGYSNVDPNCLSIWEAQFGDFSNGAQIIIDQFISSAEHKWLRMSNLVMLLPHGYEGQGPEHSSARLERFLQLCGEDNIQVANITTPANYFHALRRQIVGRNFRKPLIIMSPKSLLRHRLAVSKLSDMDKNTTFQKVIDETSKILPKDKVKRVVLCSGKIYYELLEEREKRAIQDVALIRIEQCYPFPKDELEKILQPYKNANFVWCQEEPKNMGAWKFICHYIDKTLTNIGAKNMRPIYAGRPGAASPATGYMKMHVKEQAHLINDALTNN